MAKRRAAMEERVVRSDPPTHEAMHMLGDEGPRSAETSPPTTPPPTARQDAVAAMLEEGLEEGVPAPADAHRVAVVVASHVHVGEERSPTGASPLSGHTARKNFEKAVARHLEGLCDEIHEIRARARQLTETAEARWTATMADVESKEKTVRDRVDQLSRSSGAAWEHLRDGVRLAWGELERAVHKARAEI